MSNGSEYRALVVDDELAMQRLLAGALKKQGFHCDSASDGDEAELRLTQNQYDAVVTDLRMPNKHGHALAAHLLAMDRRPVVFVHTGVTEPRLAKDLLARGVDDIVFKPFNFGILAAKVMALVKRRFPKTDMVEQELTPASADRAANEESFDTDSGPISLAQLESKLANVSTLLPVSTTAMDVYRMTTDENVQAPQLAEAIQLDASFAAEVLRIANSSYYGEQNRAIAQLDRAVGRIGRKKIGELAMAVNALSAFTSKVVDWMDVSLVWRQSMAAGLAVENLVKQGRHHAREKGLLLSAIMHPLGRIALGRIYPKHYKMLVDHCKISGEPLEDRESLIFPKTHAEVLKHLLANWKVPEEVGDPLENILSDYESLSLLPEPVRTRTELVKLACFLGRLAVGKWESWDRVEIPPASALERLGIHTVTDIVERTKVDLERMAAVHANPASVKSVKAPESLLELHYCDLSDSGVNFLRMMLAPMGIKPVSYCDDDTKETEKPVLVDCTAISPEQLAERAIRASQLLIVCNSDGAEYFAKLGKTLVLPCSYGRLRAACLEASSVASDAKSQVGTRFSQLA
jgi:HD-like signal output (HDOD) protein/DNA-binding response OmpR family regulator